MRNTNLEELDRKMISFQKEADEVKSDVDYLHHQMSSVTRLMERVNKKIFKLQEHEMFDDLPTEFKECLFKITGGKK